MAIEVKSIKDAIIKILAEYDVSKYRLAKDLNLSTATHINNYLTGTTKKARVEVLGALYSKYDILVESYKDTAEYRKLTKPQDEVKDIKI